MSHSLLSLKQLPKMAYNPPIIYGKFLCCRIELDATIIICPFFKGAEYIRVTLNADNKGVPIESIKVNLALNPKSDSATEQDRIVHKITLKKSCD